MANNDYVDNDDNGANPGNAADNDANVTDDDEHADSVEEDLEEKAESDEDQSEHSTDKFEEVGTDIHVLILSKRNLNIADILKKCFMFIYIF